MKKLIVLFGLVLMLFSCRETAVIDGKIPFIVTKVEHVSNYGTNQNNYDHKLSYYYSTFDNGYEGYFFQKRARVILPTGVANIGDTITSKNFINEKN